MPREEGQCPQCGEWSEVVCEDYVAPFVDPDDGLVKPVHVWGWWWKDSAGCPKCGATILVESECNFRKVAA